MPTPTEALQRLVDGNRRYTADQRTTSATAGGDRRAEVAGSQHPFAIILGCADSRVPPELVFDQGIGDLFVVRVAGNIATPTQVGSVEFAAANFGSSLVVVLGHSRCGAIAATLGEIQQPAGLPSPDLAAIVDEVRPAVAPLLDTPAKDDPDQLLAQAVRANVRAAAGHLRNHSEILKSLVADGKLQIVGADYDLDTGHVNFFDTP